MRQVLSEHPLTGELGIGTPHRKPGRDDRMTDEEVEQRFFNHLVTKVGHVDENGVVHRQLNVRFATTNTTLNSVDREFRSGIRESNGVFFHNMSECRDIAHVHRRVKRDKDMKPYDDIIMKQIPGNDAVEAEAARVRIRAADATKQTSINAASSISTLKGLI